MQSHYEHSCGGSRQRARCESWWTLENGKTLRRVVGDRKLCHALPDREKVFCSTSHLFH